MFKKIIILILIILVGGLSGIFADRYLFPRMASSRFFSKYKILKKFGEDVTVINKTEQVYIKEESSINKLTNQITPAIVNIISYPEDNPKIYGQKQLKDSVNATGEIVTSDGMIMTYVSAIIPDYFSTKDFSADNPKRIFKVLTNDGNVYDGKLVGIDSWSNLAFLKIEAGNLPVVSLGNSDEYNPGEKIIAINNDQTRYQNQFTSGLLSSFNPYYNISGEALSTAEKLEGVFLTDFDNNFISTGGPVIDYSGQVVGLTGSTIKNGKKEYFQIPSNKVKLVLDKMITGEINSNVSLGIYYLPINKSLVLANNLNSDRGALIYSNSGQQGLAVISNSNADKAGLKINDIIQKVDNIEVNFQNNLSNILYKYKKGDKIEFSLIRGDKEIKKEVQF